MILDDVGMPQVGEDLSFGEYLFEVVSGLAFELARFDFDNFKSIASTIPFIFNLADRRETSASDPAQVFELELKTLNKVRST